MIDKDYKAQLDSLGLDYDSIKDLNATDDLLQWNISDFKSVMTLFVNYHNAVAGKLAGGDNSTANETEEMAMGPEGWNSTKIDEMLVLEDHWKPEYDNMTLL